MLVWCLYSCVCLLSVYDVVAVTVMHIPVVCDACVYAARMLGCEGDGNAGVRSEGGVVAVSAYMGGTRGSGVLSSAGDVYVLDAMVWVVWGKWVGGLVQCLGRWGGVTFVCFVSVDCLC